ncbi:hypothetical protein C7N43_04120 [Sphingobacteriales bacterium UPWRP_1]|nr:hypothetical protein C7N43_04120 [Sphingobacteriales bacterium UPWRP_1]
MLLNTSKGQPKPKTHFFTQFRSVWVNKATKMSFFSKIQNNFTLLIVFKGLSTAFIALLFSKIFKSLADFIL